MATKKTRTKRSHDERRAIVRDFVEAKRKDPNYTLRQFSKRVGIYDTQIRKWAQRYGPELGWSGYAEDAVSETATAPETSGDDLLALAPSVPAPSIAPSGEWVKKNAEALGKALGKPDIYLGRESDTPGQATLISSGPRPGKKKMGRPTDAERALRKERSENLFALAPRQVEVHPPEQPELPFRAEPVRREAPPSEAPSHFMRQALERSMRERDALLTTLEIMFREGRMPKTGGSER